MLLLLLLMLLRSHWKKHIEAVKIVFGVWPLQRRVVGVEQTGVEGVG
jgi:hypothetical protein